MHLMRADARCHPGRHRHGAGRRSAADLPAARHDRALAGAGRARRQASHAARQPRSSATARETPVWVVRRSRARPPMAEDILQGQGRRGVAASTARTAASTCTACCKALAGRGITRLMVEGGPTVAAAFLEADLVDEAALFRSPERRSAPTASMRWRACRSTALTQSPRLNAAWQRRRSARDTLGTCSSGREHVHRHRHRCRRGDRGRAARRRSAPAQDRLRLSDATRSRIGASIACSGVCLTVVETGKHGNRTWFAVDAAAETLADHHGGQLEAGHAAQSRTRAENRRRARRPHRRGPCRRHRRA